MRGQAGREGEEVVERLGVVSPRVPGWEGIENHASQPLLGCDEAGVGGLASRILIIVRGRSGNKGNLHGKILPPTIYIVVGKKSMNQGGFVRDRAAISFPAKTA